MDTSSLVCAELSLFAFREGERLAPGSDDAKHAIAFIFSNRVKAGWQGSDWLKLLENAHLHSASEPHEMLTMKMPDIWSHSWKVLSRLVDDIYAGMAQDNLTFTPSKTELAANLPGSDRANQSRPSFFYANLNMPIRPWFIEKIIQKRDDHPVTVNVRPLVLFG
jgi:hypothetical protein